MENKGQVLSGKVISFKPYGVFVKTSIGIGMIHISEISDGFVKDMGDFFSLGDTLKVKVLDKVGKRYKFSYRKVEKNNSDIEPGFKPLREKIDNWVANERKNKKH